MKLFLITTLLMASISIATQAQDTSDMAAKLNLAKQYTQSVSIEDEINKSIEELVVQVPVEKRALLKSTLERNIKTDRLQSVSEMALADVFTLDELKALVDFYSTAEGKAIKEKMPQYQARLEPILGQMIRDAVESYDRQSK